MMIPEIGLGTWMLYGKECEEVVKTALELGYRHFDTAFAYENHEAIGKAIQGFDREKLFITSKLSLGSAKEGPLSESQVDPQNIERSTNEAVDLALKQLNTDYLDLMLIHWPNRNYRMNQILQTLVDNPKVRGVGGSNFTAHHLQDFYDAGIEVDAIQVEFHPYLNQKELLSFCLAHGTDLIAYRPFGKGKLLQEEPLFSTLGEKYHKSATQVILRWFFQNGIPVIAKSSSREHLVENLNIYDFTLTPEDSARIDSLNQGKRFCTQPWAEFDY